MTGKLFKPKLLQRKRINKILEGIFQVPLFLLLSSIGYGKTTAVKDFLNSRRNFRYAWLSLNSGEYDELWMWQKFCQSLSELNPKLAKRLAEHGFPQTTVDMERILDLIKNALAERTVIVIDDYHENRSELMDGLLTFFARAALNNLHIVLISRTLPKIPVEELSLKGLCIELSQDSFEFNKEETGKLFAQNGFPLTPEELKRLHINTDGWTAAIYLALLKYAEDKRIEDIRDVTRLMKTAVYDKFDRETQIILLKLSLLDSFTLDGAVFVTGNQRSGELIHEIAANNCFLRYDNKNKVYSIHAILKAMLNELFAISDLDKYSLLARCGDYCARADKYIEAIHFYHQAGSFGKILDIFERPGSTEVFDRAPQTVIRAFTDIDKALKLSRPLAYLTYIYSYLGVIDPEEGARMLYEAKVFYEAEQNLVDKEQILGEIALAESVLQFNDAPRMSEYQKKAYDLFGGTSSRIANATESFTFGSPHTLYLYHRERGKLLSLVETIEENTDYYTHVSNGCGTGFEHAARAEYCLETGDLVQAELAAYKTIFKAKTKNQLCLVICGSLCLARLAILHNKPQEALSGLS
ncbi:MAG: helix-turn-helix transcriptional regulator, partial [Clostridia bacterium]|nr:helix-turn-helix transcriptional regulator [Clostridia bacterium]